MLYRNILLIDDDEDDQEIFISALEELTDQVSCTPLDNAPDALKFLENGNHPDVIFLDLNMPVMNGQQFLAIVKQTAALKEIPVVIFSTSSNAETIRQTHELGADGFITKPDNFRDLIRVLQDFLKL